MKRTLLTQVTTTLLMAAVVLALSGCGASAPTEPPGITGVITALSEPLAGAPSGGAVATMLVEAEEPSDTAVSDKASVTVTSETELLDATGAATSPEALAEGQTVEVWFEGPVAESYPVQGTAGTVRIAP